jgi:hypothetical protein
MSVFHSFKTAIDVEQVKVSTCYRIVGERFKLTNNFPFKSSSILSHIRIKRKNTRKGEVIDHLLDFIYPKQDISDHHYSQWYYKLSIF